MSVGEKTDVKLTVSKFEMFICVCESGNWKEGGVCLSSIIHYVRSSRCRERSRTARGGSEGYSPIVSVPSASQSGQSTLCSTHRSQLPSTATTPNPLSIFFEATLLGSACGVATSRAARHRSTVSSAIHFSTARCSVTCFFLASSALCLSSASSACLYSSSTLRCSSSTLLCSSSSLLCSSCTLLYASSLDVIPLPALLFISSLPPIRQLL